MSAEAGCASDAAPAVASVEMRLGTIESVLSDLGATMRRIEASPACAQSSALPDGGAEVTRMVGEAIAAANAAGVETGSFRRAASPPSSFAVFGGHGHKLDSASSSIQSHSPTGPLVGSCRDGGGIETSAAQAATASSGSGSGVEQPPAQVRACSPLFLPRGRALLRHPPPQPTLAATHVAPGMLAARRRNPKALTSPRTSVGASPGVEPSQLLGCFQATPLPGGALRDAAPTRLPPCWS